MDYAALGTFTKEVIVPLFNGVGIPTGILLIVFYAIWRAGKWIACGLTAIAHFLAPLIRGTIEEHRQFLQSSQLTQRIQAECQHSQVEQQARTNELLELALRDRPAA